MSRASEWWESGLATAGRPGRVTHVVLRDGLPLASWVEHRLPPAWGLDANTWDAVRVGPDGTAELSVDDSGWPDELGASWSDDRSPGRDDEPAPEQLWHDTAYGSGAWGRGPTVPRLSADEIDWRQLADEVGGDSALRALDAAALPVEGLDWDTIPTRVHTVATEVVTHLDDVFEQWPDEEWRTACHRMLTLAVAGAPSRLEGHPALKTAAALYWAIGRASHLIGPREIRTNAEVLDHFGLQRGPVVDHAHRLLEPTASIVWGSSGYGRLGSGTGFRLGRPELLVSGRRATIIRERDRLLLRMAPAAAEPAQPPALETVTGAPVRQDDPPPWERSLRLLAGDDG